MSALRLLASVVTIGILCGAQTRPAANNPVSVTAKAIPQQAGAGYAGSARCKSCHKPEFTEFGKTGHATLPEHKDAVAGCEMCHGAGKAHADAQEASHGDETKSAAANKLIFAFRGSSKVNSERCLQCHQSSKQQSQFDHSSHALNGVACQDCHAIHLVAANDNPQAEAVQSAQAKFFSVPSLPEENRWLTSSLLKKNQPELCYQCHANVRAAFAPEAVLNQQAPIHLQDDGRRRGLHFIAINASIARQFEFLAQTWCNNPNFAVLFNDKDPIIGNNDGTSFMTLQSELVRRRIAKMPRFVATKGGAYFFLPSATALRFLGQP